MEKFNKPEAWIELRYNPPASINLLNCEINSSYSKAPLIESFEWNVYTIKPYHNSNKYTKERIFVGFHTYEEAEKFTKEKGYRVMSEDISEKLYLAIQKNLREI